MVKFLVKISYIFWVNDIIKMYGTIKI